MLLLVALGPKMNTQAVTHCNVWTDIIRQFLFTAIIYNYSSSYTSLWFCILPACVVVMIVAISHFPPHFMDSFSGLHLWTSGRGVRLATLIVANGNNK